MSDPLLPLGKIPPELLSKIIARAPRDDPRVLVGPGIGMDCAVIKTSPDLLVIKTDPITFASDSAGWYAVQINANDLATTGATPRWFLLTSLLPGASTTPSLVENLSNQVFAACRELGIAVIGGHTEITHGLDRPILVGTLIGEVPQERLVTPRGAHTGDRLLLTKGIPIEATAILVREFTSKLADQLSGEELQKAQEYLFNPGISIIKDARIAISAAPGQVHAMHDPTEGGLSTALWELAEASHCAIAFDPSAVPISPLSKKICTLLSLDPLGAIASGALLMAVPPESVEAIISSEIATGIECSLIGTIEEGEPRVYTNKGGKQELLFRPERDEIAKLYE